MKDLKWKDKNGNEKSIEKLETTHLCNILYNFFKKDYFPNDDGEKLRAVYKELGERLESDLIEKEELLSCWGDWY